MPVLPPALPRFVADQLGTVRLDRAVILDLRSDTEGAVIPIGHRHPADWLAGIDAPGASVGLAALTPGRPVGAAPDGAADRVRDEERIVHVTAVVMRDGRRVGRLGLADGTEMVAASPSGLLVDALDRSLGLPTPSPSLDPGWFFAVIWLGQLGAASGRNPEPLSPQVAAGLHPACGGHEVEYLAGIDLRSYCRARHRDHVRALGWEGLRRIMAGLDVDLGFCSPRVAAWHDAGSFARWLASELPEPGLLFELVAPALAPETRRLVVAVLGPLLTGPAPGGSL